jgi:uncharacterized protein (DUF169 family)
MDRKSQAQRLESLLGLAVKPVAIAFRDTAPESMRRIAPAAPAGCGYWKLAAEGQTFYTEAEDHYTCPVGAHTHGVEVPAAVAEQLNALIGTMVQMQYIRMEEIPSIPRRTAPFRVALYAPLAEAPFEPDLVLIRGTVKQLMLLAEAAQAAGAAGTTPTMGRPTCAILPQALQSQSAHASFGCIGNRVYTGLGDDEGYDAIPGAVLDKVLERLTVIVHANKQLETFHRSRAAGS